MKQYRLQQSKLGGTVSAPPSKSHTLRAILFATMAKGTSTINNYLQSPDTKAMLSACQQLGAEISISDTQIEITGVAGQPKLPADIIDAGNSGQVLRFIASIAALIDGYTVITGDHSVRFNRPIAPTIQGLTQLGATCISTKGDNHAPLIVKGPIQAGQTTLTGEDSQPVSGILIASAFLEGKTEIHVTNPGEQPWIGLTLVWLDRFGISYTNNNFERYTIIGKPTIDAFTYTVPGDFSSMAYPLTAAIITRSQITIDNIDMQDAQGDKKIIQALKTMGAEIEVNDNSLTVHPSDLLVGSDIDVNDFIDALPILAVAACYAKGTTRLQNAGIARQKESDRLRAITCELTKMGANIIESEDSLTIQGAALHAASVESYNDHRIAMSLAIAALGITSKTTINNVECISKSYPSFIDDLRALGITVEEIS